MRDAADRNAFRAQMVARIPAGYSPWLHLAFPSLVGLAAIACSLALLRDLRPVELLTVPLTYVFANAFEWRVHKHVLHRRWRPLAILFQRHTPEHHRVFVTEDMSIQSTREFRLVLIPPYGILGILVADLPLALLFALAGLRNVAALYVATSAFFFVTYEWLHLAYHLPPESFIGRRPMVRWLRRHHAVHHSPLLMQRWNFNVTVPLWDLVRGTIYRGPAPGPSPDFAGDSTEAGSAGERRAHTS